MALFYYQKYSTVFSPILVVLRCNKPILVVLYCYKRPEHFSRVPMASYKSYNLARCSGSAQKFLSRAPSRASVKCPIIKQPKLLVMRQNIFDQNIMPYLEFFSVQTLQSFHRSRAKSAYAQDYPSCSTLSQICTLSRQIN